MVEYIDSCGYINDTSHMIKVTHYRGSDSVFEVNNYIFGKVSVKNNYLMEMYEKYKSDVEMPLINPVIAAKVLVIFEYYYKQKKPGDYIYDGLIEEWRFNNYNEAHAFLQDVKRVKGHMYFNTESFCCMLNNSVFIFHTRAMAFSSILFKFYIRFKSEYNTISN